MKVLLFAAAAVISLSACQTKPVQEMSYSERNALAGEIAKRCAAQGYKDGHPQQADCIKHEVNREVYTRHANRQRQVALGNAVASASQGYGNSLQNNSASYSRPVNCRSVRAVDNSIQTVCQ